MLCTALLAFTLGHLTPVHAGNENKLPFAITPVFPTNQDKNVRGYYKLDFEKGKKQTIKIKIRNDKNGELTLLTTSLNALTIANGGIDYSEKTKNESSQSLDENFLLKPMLQLPESITLKKGETKEIAVEITSPDVTKGTVLGGIDFVEKDASDSGEIGNEGGVSFNIQNKVDFKLAIQLDYTKDIDSDLSIGGAPFKSLPSGPQLYVKLINNAPSIEENLEGTYEVFEPSGKSLFTGIITDLKMAPKTDVNFPIAWDGKTIGEGKYTINTTITKAGKQLTTSTNTFVIEEKNIINILPQDANEPTVIVKEKSMAGQYMLFAGLVVVAMAIGILLGRTKRKEEPQDTNKE